MDELVQRCNSLLDDMTKFPLKQYDEYGEFPYYYHTNMTQRLQKWISSVSNLISITVSERNHFHIECQKLISDEHFKTSVPYHVVERLSGLLESFRDELQQGLLRKLEYIVMATTFDEFLDHAEYFHKGGKQQESSVLASVVFEDTIRKIAKKNLIEEKGVDLETIINELTKIDVFTPVKANRAKGFGAVRNKALHAQWYEFDLKDVGGLISGTRELIEKYL